MASSSFYLSTLCTLIIALCLVFYVKHHLASFCPYNTQQWCQISSQIVPPIIKTEQKVPVTLEAEKSYTYTGAVGAEAKTFLNPLYQDYA